MGALLALCGACSTEMDAPLELHHPADDICCGPGRSAVCNVAAIRDPQVLVPLGGYCERRGGISTGGTYNALAPEDEVRDVCGIEGEPRLRSFVRCIDTEDYLRL
jgi:hypothetical protein